MPEATNEWHENLANKAFCEEPKDDETADDVVAESNDVEVDEWGEEL